jgi:hypothetical protein
LGRTPPNEIADKIVSAASNHFLAQGVPAEAFALP